MPRITVVKRNGDEASLEAADGMSLMETLRDAGFDELLALCGGCLSCATCHVHIDLPAGAMVPPMSNDERDLLESSMHVQENSRLSCQIFVSASLEGARVEIAPAD